MAASLQIQSVIYHNEKESLMRALTSAANAIRVNRETTAELGEVTLFYGDASEQPVFSEDEVAQISAQFAPFFQFRYMFFQENTGSAKGHNRLGERCESEYMMIMNPDVLLCPNFFGGMMSMFADPAKKAGMVEARQTPVEHPKEYDRKTLETGWATTACAIFSTELFRQLKGFDSDTFFLYCDDVDFSWRVRLAGKKIYYRPDCVVFHAKRLSAGAKWQPTNAERYYSMEASLLMAYKWSNMKRFHKLYSYFASLEDKNAQKVIRQFEKMKKNGHLPKQLDKDHKIAKFVGDNFTKHRFVL